MEKRFSWRLASLASAVALLGLLASFQAQALGLGRISVQSALGEPLRAEIDISDINAGEASSLKASVASAEAFRAAGMEYSPSVSDLQISLQKRGDGRSYLRLSSVRAVTEPFVDLILEASWSSGRIVRDYTMLFDPPNLRQAANTMAATPITAPVTAPVAPIPAASVAQSAPAAPGPYYSGNLPPAQAAVRPAPTVKAQPAKAMAAAPKAAVAGGQQLAVKPGDTAGKIAAQVKPASVSLDQMLVALLRSNPDAFIGGNINRLKSGSMLDIPSAEEASAVLASVASTTIVAQSKDFNDFRRKLAEGVPATQVESANRQASGKVQAKVEDKAPVAATPDKLTLSKGAVQSKAATEDKIAKDRQAKEAADRVAELSKNISDLNKLTSASPLAGAVAASSPSSVKSTGVAVAKPGAVATLPVASAAAPAPAAANASNTAKPVASAAAAAPATAAITASAPSAPTAAVTASTPAATAVAASAVPNANSAAVAALASAPVPAPAVVASAPALPTSAAAAITQSLPASAAPTGKKPAVAAAMPPEPSLMDELTENPFVLPGFAGLMLLLGGFGYYRYRKRNDSAQVDSSFLESRLQPDSFFGASGGQRIDTNEGGATGSSLVYSPSQLDAAGDVDPVAEADVYLAYGRDLQAEEILKEAMRTTPNRVAIHAKLMEIYAKRRDIKAFEVIAMTAFNLTLGEGAEWAYISEMGRGLDPSNVLYQPGGQPADSASKKTDLEPVTASGFSAATVPQMTRPEHEPVSASVDFDLDLDFSIGDEPASTATPAAVQTAKPNVTLKPAAANSFDSLDMDFDTGMVAVNRLGSARPASAAPAASTLIAPSLDDNAADALLASGLTFTSEPFASAKPSATPAAAMMDHGMLEFDMGSLSLDLDDGPKADKPSPTAGVHPPSVEGPLETKFALAEEFRALGDMDGARALAGEVLAKAQGSLKSKAQAFVNALP